MKMHSPSDLLGTRLLAISNTALDNQATLITMADAATSPAVRVELDKAIEQSATHLRRLDEIFDVIGPPRVTTGNGCIGRPMDTGADWASHTTGARERDTKLIAWTQRMLFDEINAYCRAHECALELQRDGVIGLLGQTLKEKYALAKHLVTLSEFVRLRRAQLASA